MFVQVPMKTWLIFVSLSECPETRISHVFIGTCTNGRIEDLRQAAEALKGNRISGHVRCIITPASKNVMIEAIKERLIELFMQSGAIVTTPGCGSCIGRHEGVLGPGDVCVSTMN